MTCLLLLCNEQQNLIEDTTERDDLEDTQPASGPAGPRARDVKFFGMGYTTRHRLLFCVGLEPRIADMRFEIMTVRRLRAAGSFLHFSRLVI